MRNRSGVFIVGFVAMALVACGGDGGGTEPGSAVAQNEPNSGGTVSDGGLDIAGSVDDSDLVVPRDYLQGEWCSSDGQTLTITGDMVRMEDQSGGVGEFPVDLAFVDGPGTVLVSQTDVEFVVEFEGAETTFSRGRC